MRHQPQHPRLAGPPLDRVVGVEQVEPATLQRRGDVLPFRGLGCEHLDGGLDRRDQLTIRLGAKQEEDLVVVMDVGDRLLAAATDDADGPTVSTVDQLVPDGIRAVVRRDLYEPGLLGQVGDEVEVAHRLATRARGRAAWTSVG